MSRIVVLAERMQIVQVTDERRVRHIETGELGAGAPQRPASPRRSAVIPSGQPV
jgi:hypothetical protein